MARFKQFDKTDSTMQDFLDVQLLRVKAKLGQWERRVIERRQERLRPLLAEMDFESRQSQILRGGMGPRRPSLSEMDGDYDNR